MSLTLTEQPLDSLRESVKHLPRSNRLDSPRLRLLAHLLQNGLIDDEAAQVAQYDFETWFAREGQIAPELSQGGTHADGTIIPPSVWTVWLALAGRGFGKTRTGVEWVLNRKVAKGLGPGAIIGRTGRDVRDVLVEGPAGILACSPPWNRPHWEPGKARLTWPNGVVATVFSAEAPDQLRGPQHNWALADELEIGRAHV